MRSVRMRGLEVFSNPRALTAQHFTDFSRTSMKAIRLNGTTSEQVLLKWVETWSPPIGVLVSGDLYCRYLMEACHTIGLHVPQDIALIGTHNEPNICDSPSPTITSIDMGFEEIGYRAAGLLDRLMKGKREPTHTELIKPQKLVTRQSTDSFATEDPLVSNALRFMAENSNRPLSVQDIALAVGLNRRSLERRFNKYSAEGIAKQITRMRIERAKRLILETQGSLKSIAIECGFRNSDHLGQSFPENRESNSLEVQEIKRPCGLKPMFYRYRAIPVLASFKGQPGTSEEWSIHCPRVSLGDQKILHQILIYEEIRLRYFHLVWRNG